MYSFEESLENGLSCRIDWLSFTIDSTDVQATLDDFGFVIHDFHECPKGANGYKKMLMLSGSTLRVLYDGNENMGVHFDVSGSAMSDLFEYYKRTHAIDTPWGTEAIDWDLQVMSDLLARVQKLGHVTRLDLAIDNEHDIYYRLEELEEILRAQRFVSKFRSWRHVVERTTMGARIGDTLYLGSRSSDIMLRVYDKQLERQKSGEVIDHEWVRWELELKDERAQQAVQAMIGDMGVGDVCVGILQNYFRIINFDDCNKSRCSTDIKWDAFVNGIKGLRLYIPHDEKTLEQKQEWIVRQVAPTLAGLIIAKQGDVSFLMNEMDTYAGRMNKHMKELVSEANPDWLEDLYQFRAGRTVIPSQPNECL